MIGRRAVCEQAQCWKRFLALRLKHLPKRSQNSVTINLLVTSDYARSPTLIQPLKGIAMATDGSVAPKERVNIVYRPAIGDAKAEVELPLKLLILGDYTLRQDDTPLEELKPINIDKDNFNDVLKAQKLSLSLSVPNKLDEKADPDAVLAMQINFESINDFSPDAIVDKVPELKQMIELRDALKALKGPLGNIPDFRKKVQELVQDEGVRARLLSELGVQDK